MDKKDWRTSRHTGFIVLLLLIAGAVVTLYYLNYPFVETNSDTVSYLHVVQQMLSNGNPVDPFRMPAYPLMIVVIYLVTGQGNLMAVSIVQAILFVLATVELYVLAMLLFHRAWLAFVVCLLVGTNVILISFVKPIMTEGPSLWLLTTMMLFSVLILQQGRLRLLWGIAILLPLLMFTRPEWTFLPVLLFGYLFLARRGSGTGKYLLSHIAISLAGIYTLVVGYITANALMNNFVGLTTVQNMNLIGKVLQYQMQDEAPPQYQTLSHRLDPYVAHHAMSPFYILGQEPDLRRNHGQILADFAKTIILQHPGEFLLKSIPYFFSSLVDYYPVGILQARPIGPFDAPLSALMSFDLWLYGWNVLFPYCALLWLVLLCWKRTRSLPLVQGMGLIVLVIIYAIIITTLGGYFPHDYMRVHIVFDPLIMLTVWGTLLYGIVWGVQTMKNLQGKR